MQQRMALPGAKPPRAQRHSLNPPSAAPSPSPSFATRLSQPPSFTSQMDQNFTRTGREAIRRKKPVPMPRTFVEMPIDVPVDFENAAYGHSPHKKPAQPNNQRLGLGLPNRPKSIVERASQLNGYRVSHKYYLDFHNSIHGNQFLSIISYSKQQCFLTGCSTLKEFFFVLFATFYLPSLCFYFVIRIPLPSERKIIPLRITTAFAVSNSNPPSLSLNLKRPRSKSYQNTH